MISLGYSMFIYFFSLMMFSSCSNTITFWMVMEVNLVAFVYLMFTHSSGESKFMFEEESVFFYFIIQSLGSFFFLFSLYAFEELRNFSDFFFMSAIILKLGIFPLFFWILELSGSLSMFIFILILTFQKVPMFMIFFNMDSFYILMYLLSSFIYGSFMLLFSTTAFSLMVFSSISSSFWIFIMYLHDISFYLLFFSAYSICMLSFMKGVKSNLVSSYAMFFIFISGMPPFSLFFFKFYMCSWPVFSSSHLPLLSFWALSFMALMGYFKFFYNTLFSSFHVYLKQKFCLKNMSILVGSLAGLAPFLA